MPELMEVHFSCREDTHRYVQCFRVTRSQQGGRLSPPIPDLMDVELLGFSRDRALMVRDFEETDGARYYQG